ncbi:MAG: 50S ribosomal protein L3 [Nanoarchaeota archaeon]
MKISRPRFGSLQFYPRKRAAKQLPSVNWDVIKSDLEGVLGFITYKVGMATAIVKDTTDKSMTSGKKIALPITVLEAPNMKIFSIRFYKNKRVVKDFVVSNDKELKKILKTPKNVSDLSKIPEDYDDIRAIVYSIPKTTGIKKTPDIIEVGISAKNKLEFVKSLINKEIALKDFLKYGLLDVRGLTKGYGLSGTVKRFGISLKQHKSEKGRRRPGSLGPWHPARVTFRTPMAGQLGMFSRVNYNNKVIGSGDIKEKDINPKSGWKHFGRINNNYLLIAGSVQGPPKRQILLTPSFRATKEQAKKKYELIELVGGTK